MTWLIFLSGVTNLFLGLFIWRRSPRAKLNRYFAILGIITALWVLNNSLFRINPDIRILRNSYALGSLVPLLSLFWILGLGGKKITLPMKVGMSLCGLLFFVLPHLDGLVIKSITSLKFAGYQGVTGPLFPLYSAYVFIILFIVVIQLIMEMSRARGIKRTQARLVLIGISIWITCVVAVSFALPLFGYLDFTSLDSPSSLFFIGFIAYAMTRYRLMDIRAVIVRTIAFGFIVALLVAAYAAISALIALLFENIARVESSIIVSIITSLFVVLGYSPLRKFTEKATEKFLFKKSYDPDKLLAKVTEVTSSILDLTQLLKSLSMALGGALHYEKFGVVLLDEKNKMEIFYKEGFKEGVAEGLVSYKGVVVALYKELEQTPGLLVIDEMKTRFENGEFKPADPILLNLLHENDIAVIVPLYVKDRLIGIFAVGNKKSGDSYNTQDLNILRIIAGQAGVAIENARLYEELKTFSAKLEQEVRKKTMQLRTANTTLKQLDKAKSEFISIASHQLRTPLTVIKGYISMMQEGSFGEVPKPIAENLTKVFISNERLIHLVEDLLNISRIESGRQEFTWAKIRLENLAQTVVDNLTQNAKLKNLKLTFHAPVAATPEVVADENKLHEVMMNFVDNAIKYTPAGQIDVTVRIDPGDVVTFCVKDTGKGIATDLQTVLFQKFSRGKDSFKSHTQGLGLGLYVAKLIMEAHKGRIWAESEGEGKGSSFCFSIPVKGVELKAGVTSETNLIKPSAPQPAPTPPTVK